MKIPTLSVELGGTTYKVFFTTKKLRGEELENVPYQAVVFARVKPVKTGEEYFLTGPVAEAKAFCSKKDDFSHAEGRKCALERATRIYDKGVRLPLWIAFYEAYDPPRAERIKKSRGL